MHWKGTQWFTLNLVPAAMSCWLTRSPSMLLYCHRWVHYSTVLVSGRTPLIKFPQRRTPDGKRECCNLIKKKKLSIWI